MKVASRKPKPTTAKTKTEKSGDSKMQKDITKLIMIAEDVKLVLGEIHAILTKDKGKSRAQKAKDVVDAVGETELSPGETLAQEVSKYGLKALRDVGKNLLHLTPEGKLLTRGEVVGALERIRGVKKIEKILAHTEENWG